MAISDLFTPGGLRIEGEVFIPSQIRLIDALNLAYGNFYAILNAKLFTHTMKQTP